MASFDDWLVLMITVLMDSQIPALVPVFIMSIGLISCILMEKVTFDYWKWKKEKTGSFLFGLCAFFSLVSSLIFCISLRSE